MKYIICNGDKKLKYTLAFASIEECIAYLHSQFSFKSLYCTKLRSLHIEDCYTLIGYFMDKTRKEEDFLIYGCKDYEQKEKI